MLPRIAINLKIGQLLFLQLQIYLSNNLLKCKQHSYFSNVTLAS